MWRIKWGLLGALIGQTIFTLFIQRDTPEFFASIPFEERIKWFFPHNFFFIFALIGGIWGLIAAHRPQALFSNDEE